MNMSATMEALPTEIISEILSKLPVKSIHRCKCVCKSWYSLLKSPNFIKIHLNKTLISSSDVHLIIQSLDSSLLHSAELDLHRNNHLHFSELHHPLKSFKIVNLIGSCNGVVCISDDSRNNVFLYNPLTNSHRKLPEIQIPNLKDGGVLLGYGYDAKNDDYKVLRIVQGDKYDKSYHNEAQLFSLNNNSWKSVEGIPHILEYGDCHGVLVNEALHYIASTDKSELKFPKLIASFDLRTESFSFIDCPNYDDKLKDNSDNLEHHLSNLGGCLSLMVNYHTNKYADMMPPDYELREFILYRADLWLMKEFGNKKSWFRLFSTFDLKGFRSCLSVKPVVYSKDGRRILMEIDCLEVGWYDWEAKKVQKLKTHGLPNKVHSDTRFFVGSLVSLEYNLLPKRDPLPNKKSKGLDNFLSVGFKLKL